MRGKLLQQYSFTRSFVHYCSSTHSFSLESSMLMSKKFTLTWKRCRSVLCRTSNMHTSPFLPAEINNWCCGAYTKLEAPWSWHVNAKSKKRSNFLFILFINSTNRLRIRTILKIEATYMPPWISFEVIMCPTSRHFCFPNCDQLQTN